MKYIDDPDFVPKNQNTTDIDKDGLENDDGYYMGYNKTFGWTHVYAGHIEMICPKASVSIATQSARKPIDVNVAIGEGDDKGQYKGHIHVNELQKLKEAYFQPNYHTPGLCVWLSMTMMVEFIDKDLATLMLESFYENEARYLWLTFKGNTCGLCAYQQMIHGKTSHMVDSRKESPKDGM